MDRASILVRINCHKVAAELKSLTADQAWIRPIPFVNRAVIRMEHVSDKWIADDSALYKADEQLREEMNAFLEEITDMPDRVAAFQEFKRGLKWIEKTFKALQAQSGALEVLSGGI